MSLKLSITLIVHHQNHHTASFQAKCWVDVIFTLACLSHQLVTRHASVCVCVCVCVWVCVSDWASDVTDRRKWGRWCRVDQNEFSAALTSFRASLDGTNTVRFPLKSSEAWPYLSHIHTHAHTHTHKYHLCYCFCWTSCYLLNQPQQLRLLWKETFQVLKAKSVLMILAQSSSQFRLDKVIWFNL